VAATFVLTLLRRERWSKLRSGRGAAAICRASVAKAAAAADIADRWAPLRESLRAGEGAEQVLGGLRDQGLASRWGIVMEGIQRSLRGRAPPAAGYQELKALGIQEPERLSGSEDPDILPVAILLLVGVLGSVAGQAIGNELLAILPLGVVVSYLAIGGIAPGLLFPVTRAFAEFLNPEERDRIPRYEAAHLLAGYLLGLTPTNATGGDWRFVGSSSLPDTRAMAQESSSTGFAVRVANFAPPPALRRGASGEGEAGLAEMDAYAALMSAGPVGEALTFGSSEGGGEDLQDLQTAISAFLRNSGYVDETVQTLTLRGAYRAALLLREYRPQWDALTRALADGGGGDVVGCFAILEATPAPEQR